MQTRQRVVGVVENMSWLELPDGTRQEIFGSGGGQAVADSLTQTIGASVPLLGQIPIGISVRRVSNAGAVAATATQVGTLGNFVNRCATQVDRHFDGLVPAGGEVGEIEAALVDRIAALIEEYRTHFDGHGVLAVNLDGVVWAVQAVLPTMRAARMPGLTLC